MFGHLLAFELRSHFRRPVTWLYVAIMFLLAFFAISTDAVTVGESLGKVKKNSPYSLAQMYGIVLAIGQIVTSALVGTTVLRDVDVGVHELLFTTRLTRRGYLGAKFLAAFAAMLLVFAALPVGALLGTVMPWVNAETVQAIRVWDYVQPFLVIGVPGVFFLSALIFTTGTLTRSAFAVYVSGILLLVGYSIAANLIRTLDYDQLANLVDPFAIRSISLETRYWTPAERNARLLPLGSFLLANRALWAAIGAVLLAVAFRFTRLEVGAPLTGRRRKAAPAATAASGAVPVPVPSSAPAAATGRRRAPSLGTAWWDVTRFQATAMVRSVPFLAIAAIGMINTIMNAWFADQSGVSRSWPMSWIVSESVIGGNALFMIVLLTFYAGELVWRERQLRADQVADATPVPTAAVLLGKYTAMLGVLFAYATAVMLAGMAVPLLKGFPVVDAPVYLWHTYPYHFPGWIAMTALAFLAQALVPRKAIGHVIVILVFVANIALSNLGYTHQLLRVATSPDFTWTDLNGLGGVLPALVTLHGYSLSLAAVLLAVTYVVWPRGTAAAPLGVRLATRFRRPARVATAGGVFGMAAFGGTFFYNANILNRYEARKTTERRLVEYERRWRPLEALPVPKVVATSLVVDLAPTARTARLSTRYTMVNRAGRALDSVLVNVASDAPGLAVTLDSLVFDRGATLLAADTAFGVRLLRLAQPLAPGDTLRLHVVQRLAARGFPNGAPDRSLVANGTFLNREWFPTLGYSQGGELGSDELRKKYGLPPTRRALPRTDVAGLQRQSFTADADFVAFDATVSTDPDQIAMAPGYLEREWMAGGRRYFRYVMDAPIPNFFAVLSARWTVTRGAWGQVPIEVYHHPAHRFNVSRMIEAAQASLALYDREFGPYQHRQLRIVEFPRYQEFAQSFPNTVPYSEGIGFVARVDSTDVEDTDLPYFVTAHEIAHQWFPYQRMPADVEGAQALSEALSEYAALVATARKHGLPFTQKFLRSELDGYLRGRASETRGERPLTRVDRESYVWYQKGSLALFALRELIGEATLHRAIRAYLDEGRFTGPPYATTFDLMRHLTAATPDSLRYALTDYFDTITLWDVRADSATSRQRADGQYEVTVVATAKKFRADSVGNETAIPMADYVDVGVFDAPAPGARLGRPLAIRRVKVTTGMSRHTFVVPKPPTRAGIDPYSLLIDRNPGDNTREVKR
jgi:ABC-type transport system involved in multi-copper enzyme maturation permease subunit